MKRAGLCLLLLLLAGCGTLPAVRAVDATGGGVAYQFPADQQAEATRRATLYCANLGRSAVLRQITRETGELSVARFECR